jgi:3'-5' exoribonuclease
VVLQLGRERQWISGISARGTGIDEAYVIKRKDPPRKGRKSNHFFSLTVSDATGEIKVNYWGNSDESVVRKAYDSVHEGAIVRIKGTSDQFNDAMVIQVNISNGEDLIEEAKAGDYDPADFVACTEKDTEAMYTELQGLLAQISDPDINAVLGKLFGNADLVQKFKSAPASVSYHCAWVGGLLEHTLNVARACDFISRMYPALDRDLLLASAALHDIGKVCCYNVSTTITESVSGRLLGHIVIGAQMVEDACNRCDGFPQALRTKLVHMVLASHGTNEKGSPAEAAIPEALALNFADEMDAKLERFIRARGNGGPEDTFVIDRSLGTKIYLG